MFKVMIVEDEPPIMRSVRSALERADSDFHVEKCCINGVEAKAALENEDFDIVITDIKMPIMTGIELAGWIHENKPNTMVILLSGYQDFEYARRALEYKVFDYIPKPLSRDNIKELTVRIKAEFSKNTSRTIADGEKYTVVMLACAGTYLLHGADVLTPGERFWADDMINSLMNRILQNGEEYVFFNTNVQSERIIIISTDTMERQEVIVREFAESFGESSLPLTIVYRAGVKFKDAGQSIPLLREQLIKRLILGKSQLIPYSNTPETYDNIAIPYSKADIDAVTAAIRSGNTEAVKTNLKKLLLLMRDNSRTQEEVVGLLNVILDTYTLNYPNKLKRPNSTVKREIVTAVAGFTSYEALLTDTASIFMTLKTDDKNTGRYAQLADEIEEYINKNYNKAITSETLSREFGFVPSYISRIFKRERGISPSEYVTRCRIQAAKDILIANPDIKIKEVANMTGFKEAYYFSKTFKRETGMWPTEFAGTSGKEE